MSSSSDNKPASASVTDNSNESSTTIPSQTPGSSDIVPAKSNVSRFIPADEAAGEDAVINVISPVLTKLGYGGVLGLCVGYTVRETGKVAAYLIGGTFIFLQSLQYAGFIEIKWDNIRRFIMNRVDTDGDGKVGLSEIRHYMRSFTSIMVYQSPIAGGFASGFYMALLM